MGVASDRPLEPPPMSIAAIRKRPGMFVGGTDESGVLNLVLEVVAK